VAGGVVANVKLNQRLLALEEVPSLFVYPAMGDDGLAAGAAHHVYAQGLPEGERESAVRRLADVYLGSEFSPAEILAAIRASGRPFDRPKDLAGEVARRIAEGGVVARFDGRMEFGPRALGNRSILVGAADPSVNDWLNKRLERTEFMPFAPVSLAEEKDRFYRGLEGAEHAARFMTVTCDCTPELSELCPAVVHVDGTARPQLVDRSSNPGYRAILEAYQRIEGHSTLINTSFNMHEEPIVRSPEDAVRAFTLGHLDYLAIGEYLVASR
jgi:carbamoyltransferase